MSYPRQCQRTYVNPEGNVAASGYYRPSTTQELANKLPPWMHIRQNPSSVGQQFLSATAVELKRVEQDLNSVMMNKFIDTASVDDLSVLYRVKMPSNLDLTDASASGVKCIAAPSGCSPSGIMQISVQPIVDMNEFMVSAIPNRIEVLSSGVYVDLGWKQKPSGVIDTEERYVDVWGGDHRLAWSYERETDTFRKQDYLNMDTYETYSNNNGSSYISDMVYFSGMLWAIGSVGFDSYLTVYSTKTQMPVKENLDIIAEFNITSGFDVKPSGVIMNQDGSMNVCDTDKTSVYTVVPRYDYFLVDKNNRYIYFREDYTDSGVFISNTH